MTPVEAAELINGNEYRNELTKELTATLKANRLVAVFGYSDDIAVFAGAIDDEFYDVKIFLDREGVIKNECDDDECPYYERLIRNAKFIECFWDENGYDHSYETTIPHATFEILEDGTHKYCKGIVFSLDSI